MMRGLTPQEKQGGLGNLSEKTKVELVELLARQEKILANKKFLSRLTDKGAKLESFAATLKEAIAEREEVERTMQLFEKMNLGQDDRTITDVTERKVSSKDDASVVAMVTNTTTEKGEVRLSKERTSPRGKLVDSAAADSKPVKKEKFKPNRYLHSTDIPADLSRPEVSTNVQKKEGSKVTHEELEITSAMHPPLRNQEAQIVDLKESVSLLQEQKKNVEALIAKQAADRLTERLNTRMGDFLPDVQKGSYRDQADDSDDESDGEEEDDEGEESDDS